MPSQEMAQGSTVPRLKPAVVRQGLQLVGRPRAHAGSSPDLGLLAHKCKHPAAPLRLRGHLKMGRKVPAAVSGNIVSEGLASSNSHCLSISQRNPCPRGMLYGEKGAGWGL